ncbi:MAG: SLC13 family permease [Candidatus Marsarchaeota archaeon]|nr:SLC13 family permease [Candidatus Marsarchaeota archaeon]
MLHFIPFSVIVIIIVFILIAVRQIGKFRVKIWQAVLAGAIAVIITGQISIPAALPYINLTVIIYLIAIFILGGALTESNYIHYIFYKIFKHAKSVNKLIFLVIFSMGFSSMFLLNDTLAVIGAPVVMFFAIREKINPKLMLMSLAFAITIGSVASPIGNPQNLLIASSKLTSNPFLTFFSYLLIPTVINLFIAYIILRIFFKKEFNKKKLLHDKIAIKDKKLAKLCKFSLILFTLSIIIEIGISVLKINIDFNLAFIAIIAVIPILLFSDKRVSLLKNIDWSTIVFFISLFVLIGSVWQSGFFQGLITNMNLKINSIPVILIVNLIGSQIISNVPMVMLYLKLLVYSPMSGPAIAALAAGSTIAGNFLIFGAASNIIILQIAEKKYKETISFIDFAKIGIVVTFFNILIYWIFLII